eukprot:gnl/TRDRNA2_/TRDRNA2_175031_c0_seq10.p1 gnl/TRDRNA2_/TRDRNA2_175031_c0~~gnl/TRDRNA2_/TRDRNA2_175031_c0_seq10.p1  ORF type:complete len:564 (-),score=79.20 gnl/TRDRNA2_/TRDRNA2_175031_c0_seq10:119-1810(-)
MKSDALRLLFLLLACESLHVFAIRLETNRGSLAQTQQDDVDHAIPFPHFGGKRNKKKDKKEAQKLVFFDARDTDGNLASKILESASKQVGDRAADSSPRSQAASIIEEVMPKEMMEGLHSLDKCYQRVCKMARLGEQHGLNTHLIGIDGCLADLSLNLPSLFWAHQTRSNPTSKGLETNPQTYREALYWMPFSTVSSAEQGLPKKKWRQFFTDTLPQSVERVAYSDYKEKQLLGEATNPNWFVAIDRAKNVVVLSISGTTSIGDAITDASGTSVPFPEYPGEMTHVGLLGAARNVLKKSEIYLRKSLEKHPDFGIQVVGHSLGAGAALILTLLLQAKPLVGQKSLRCIAYGPPPVVDVLDAELTKSADIDVFVNHFDVVPRISVRNVALLGMETEAVDDLKLNAIQRLQLWSNSADDALEQKVDSAVNQVLANKDELLEQFDHLYIPGRIFWIEWNEDATAARMHKVDADQFQEFPMHGGVAMFHQHFFQGRTGYERGFQLSLDYLTSGKTEDEWTSWGADMMKNKNRKEKGPLSWALAIISQLRLMGLNTVANQLQLLTAGR